MSVKAALDRSEAEVPEEEVPWLFKSCLIVGQDEGRVTGDVGRRWSVCSKLQIREAWKLKMDVIETVRKKGDIRGGSMACIVACLL